jgi:polyhydroxyalkanoate synthesis regulator phasin
MEMAMEDTGTQDVGIIEKAFLMGIGAAMLAKDKAQELADMLIERGSMSRDESRAFVDRLTAEAEEAGRSASQVMGSEAEKLAARLGLATTRDVDEIRAQLSDIQAQIATLRPAGGAASQTASGAAEVFMREEPLQP